MASTVSAVADVALGVTAAASLAFTIAAAVAAGQATEMRVDEGIGDYSQAIDDVKARAPMNREEHATAMGNMVKIRDFVAFVADQERGVEGDEKVKGDITLGKEEIGIENK